MKKFQILLIGIVVLVLLVLLVLISINTKSKLTKLMAPSGGGITIEFLGFGTNNNDATLNATVLGIRYEMPNSTQKYNIYHYSNNKTDEYYIANSIIASTKTCRYDGDPDCPYYNEVYYQNLQPPLVIQQNISDGDVFIGNDLVGLTSYVISLDTTTPEPFWTIGSNNIIHINSSATSNLQIPFTHNIIDGAGIIANYQKYNIMKIQLPNSTNVGPINIGIQGQPPKFTADFASNQTVFIFPWDTGFTQSNPNISIILSESDDGDKHGQAGDGSSFINDAYSKGYRTCNIIDDKYGYCYGADKSDRNGNLLQCTQPGLPTLQSGWISIAGC